MRKKRIFGPRREDHRLTFALSLAVVLSAFYVGYYVGQAQREGGAALPPAVVKLPLVSH